MNFKTEDTDIIICPNCGEKVKDTYDLFNEGEEEIEISCLHCGQRIKVTRRFIPKYSSYKLNEN